MKSRGPRAILIFHAKKRAGPVRSAASFIRTFECGTGALFFAAFLTRPTRAYAAECASTVAPLTTRSPITPVMSCLGCAVLCQPDGTKFQE